MGFYDVLDQVLELVCQRGRVSYHALKREFNLDDMGLKDLKEEIFFAYPRIVDEGGRGLVWTSHACELESEVRWRLDVVLATVTALLRYEKRVAYRALKQTFDIDDVFLEALREELVFKRVARDEQGKGLVWMGEEPPHTDTVTTPRLPIDSDLPSAVGQKWSAPVTEPPPPSAMQTVISDRVLTTPLAETRSEAQDEGMADTLPPLRPAPKAERRQLTVMFCDLVGSTDLSGRLDPEDWREVVRAYQETAAVLIERYEGHIAQYLGDGLLVYFGFPVAHEDDAQRAIYTGLGLPGAMAALNARLEATYGVQLAVRIGIHTGPVVVGEMGGGSRHEDLALGETPNIAARLEGLAEPNTAVMSPVTAQLVQRSFVLQELGPHELKGVTEPIRLYTVVGPQTSDQADDSAITGGFDALVGRDEEIGLLLRRWEQSKEGLGQVILLSGEAGIGKSSLVDGLRNHVRQEGLTRIAFRCSQYYTNSALYPIIEQVQQALNWQPEDTAETKLAKLEQVLQSTTLPLEESVPLLASLLSLPLSEDRYPALTLSPEQQRQQTQDALVAWLLEETERQAVLAVWEDLQWADPSTLETLGLFVDQAPTATMLHVLTFRPEFEPPWPPRSHLTPITLNRLERPQAEGLVTRLAGGKALPAEVLEHIVVKTDGVPLFVEELTKMLLESDLLGEEAEQYVLTGPLLTVAIPNTLQDSLMARLDQMNTAKEVAQLGSVLGREFAYEMLQAISWQEDEETLQAGLGQLVHAELLYQRGRLPRAKYIFKHALVQDAAYASLLRSTRQRVHQQIAQLLETRFPEVVEMQPELVAHHCTEAGQDEAALRYWRRAGQRALQHSAHVEAIAHLTQGLAVLTRLPITPTRLQQELDLQVALGPALLATKGNAAPDVERAYARARELCQQVGDTPQLFPVLRGLMMYYLVQGQLQTAHQLGEQLLELAHSQPEPAVLLLAHYQLGMVLLLRGELTLAYTHHTQALEIYTPQEHRALALRYGMDLGVASHTYLAWELWYLGYPDQALQQSQEAQVLAREMSHPHSLAFALVDAAFLHQCRRETPAAQEQAAAAMTLATEQGFALRLAQGTVLHGWALAMQGQVDVGLAEIRQGLAADLATGSKTFQPYFLGLLAEAYGEGGHPKEGLPLLDEALAVMDTTEARFYEAELLRLQGALLLRQAVQDASQAETYFHKALDIACQQHAKSLELRAATSLARLWQSQDKRQDAYDLLAPVYGWFTEGFDTADLQEAKGLLDALSEGQP